MNCSNIKNYLGNILAICRVSMVVVRGNKTSKSLSISWTDILINKITRKSLTHVKHIHHHDVEINSSVHTGSPYQICKFQPSHADKKKTTTTTKQNKTIS